jgi:cytoplasmic iron level regulating protein YaaA (DUF328/UPF0246 family)
MKILISPAKSINEQCEYPATTYSLPQFAKEAKSLARKLKKFKQKDLMSLMHVSADIADLNVQRYKNWYLSEEPTEDVRPAGYLFTGEVYKGLDLPSLTEAELLKAQERLRMLSGMYGLLRPLDLIYPYRLEMGTNWKIDENTKNLYGFWGQKLTKQLLKETAKDELIVNLASNEYGKAVQWKEIKRPVITPNFKEFKNGEFKMVMIFAKHARGAMARYLIQNDLQTAEELKLYNVDGYSFDEKQSTETEWVFVR